MSEIDVPTPVEPPVRGLRAQVAHGPAKQWSLVGRMVPVQITVPVNVVRWLRDNGYVFSRVFREAAEKLMGSGELDRLDKQVDYHREQIRILEAARATLTERASQEESARASEQARLDAVRKLAEAYQAASRGDRARFPRLANLRWLRARLENVPVLRGERAEDVLALIETVDGGVE